MRFAAIAMLAVLLVACASRTRAPVEDRTALPAAPASPAVVPAPASVPAPETDSRPTYTVKRGDTLYQIALDHGLDYKELAAWNTLENPNLIRVGQVLRVAAPGDASAAGTGATTAPLRVPTPVTATAPGAASPTSLPSSVSTSVATARNADNYKSSPKAVKEPYSEQAMRDVARSAQASTEVVALAAPPGAPKPEVPRVVSPATESDDEDKLDWVWPAKGKVVIGFSETAN